MCLPELGDDDSENFEVCCGSMHSYMASIFFCVIDFWSMLAMFFISTWFHFIDDPLRWTVLLPLLLLYVAFIFYPSGPVGLYVGNRFLIAIYFGRVIVMFLFALAWVVINFRARRNALDIVFSMLWFLMALTYFVGCYVHGITYRFYRSRWLGYDDGDLNIAGKLQHQVSLSSTCSICKKLASNNLEKKERSEHTNSVAKQPTLRHTVV